MNYELLIAAATSNTGKTTLTMGLLRALHRRGLRVQPFKCGPDYIDTMFHRQAAGVDSINLDTFMCPRHHVAQLHARYGAGADVCVVEGVMGLYDGYDRHHGSSAEVAQWLDIPVVLVVSAQSVAYSVAPLIYGFKHFSLPSPESGAERLRVAGVIFNKVASERHYEMLRDACHDAGVPCFGYLRRNAGFTVPGRHLGLTITEQEGMERLIEQVASEVEAHVDLDALLQSVSVSPRQSGYSVEAVDTSLGQMGGANRLSLLGIPDDVARPRLLVARDEAFNFLYRADLDALSEWGQVQFFSPLHDAQLPPCDWLYLPGGYPELFAKDLSANYAMRHAIRAYAEAGGRIYAECGGFMYLCQSIDAAPMCGVLPIRATMQGASLHLGYRQMEWGGHSWRGHEFHYSMVADEGTDAVEEKLRQAGVELLRIQQTASGKAVDTPIYRYKNVIAGYTHWYKDE